MSGITRRTVYYYVKDGIVRFLDWASITTGLGAMVEPFQVNKRHSTGAAIIEFEPDDMIARIDEMERISFDHHRLILGHGDPALHGGVQIPRDGQ